MRVARCMRSARGNLSEARRRAHCIKDRGKYHGTRGEPVRISEATLGTAVASNGMVAVNQKNNRACRCGPLP